MVQASAVAALQHTVEREGLTVDETAHVLGCGRVTVYKMIRLGQLRRIKIGTRTIISRSEINRVLSGDAAA